MYLLVAIAIIFFIILLYFSTYNSIVRKENAVNNAFASVDVMLNKRLELIPKLVSVVTHYMDYEKELLTNLEQLQLEYKESNSKGNRKVAIDNSMQDKLQQLHTAVMCSKELASNKNVLQLQHTLVQTEEHISAARRFYNTCVTEYNNKILSFPAIVIAKQRNLKPKQVFSIPKFDRISPDIEKLLS